MFRSHHLTSCVGTIPINPGPIYTNIIADSDFTYRLRLRFLTLQSRLCGSSCIATKANDFHHRFTSKPVTPEQHNIVHGLYWVASILGHGTARFINARRIFLRTAAILRLRLSLGNSITDFAPKSKSQTQTQKV